MRDNGSVYLNSVCVGTTFVCLFKDKVVLKLWFDFFAQNFLEIPTLEISNRLEMRTFVDVNLFL